MKHKSQSKKDTINHIHKKYMKLALRLAAHGMFTTGANPRVGCVIVQNGQVVGQAHHHRVGERHAEALALLEAGDNAIGATAYVTLEPCSHIGKNPPCADALIQAEVKTVVVCNDDPNPLVAGGGYEKLEKAGIEVIRGVLKKKGEKLNRGFLHRMRTGLPWVRTKSAQSLDGRTGMANGDSYWITGDQARADVQYWRGRSGAVVTGVETVLSDDCQLNFRYKSLSQKYKKLAQNKNINQPLRVIVDSRLRTPLNAQILNQSNDVMIVTSVADKSKLKPYLNAGISVNTMPDANGQVDLQQLCRYLGSQEINEVLVESGATLSGAFLSAGLVDEMIVYTAPVLMGHSGRPLFKLNIEEMSERHHIKVTSIKSLGKDWRLRALPRKEAK